MTRLTKDVREWMVTDLLRLRFDEAGKALAKRSAELFTLVYEDRYDAETRRLMKALMKRVKGAFTHLDVIDLNVRGMSLNIGRFRIGDEKVIFFPEITPRPTLNKTGGKFAVYSDCPISEQLCDFATDIAKFAKDIQSAKTEALGALSSVTTAKQLSEMWPEAMPVIGHRIPMPTGSNLPAVQFSKLTKAFGLEAVGTGAG